MVEQALQLTDVQIGGSAFGLALASSRHEMQYSRLFRS
jgi:urease accessory protein